MHAPEGDSKNNSAIDEVEVSGSENQTMLSKPVKSTRSISTTSICSNIGDLQSLYLLINKNI